MAPLPTEIVITDKIGVGVGQIGAPEFTKEEAQAEALEVAKFRTEIDWHNPAVCIDGRCLCRTVNNVELPLGAHMAGGAQTLLVAAESVGLPIKGKELIQAAADKGFVLGAHCDSTNQGNQFQDGTGCGANDKIELISEQFNINNQAIGTTMNALMGSDFRQDVFDTTKVSVPSKDKLSLMNNVGNDKVEILEDDGQGVHGHREQLVIFNFEPNTTIDRDAYFAATGKQVFVVDVWYIKKLAGAMADNSDQAAQLYHAMMAYQVSTYIGLCDGSHRAAIFPAEQEQVAA